MLVIRLFRVGKKNQPVFKIVVADKRNPSRAGRFVEELGIWNPLTKEKIIKAERAKYWISVGAKPSATLHNLLVAAKIIEGKKIPKHKVSPKESASAANPTGQAKKKAGEKPVEPVKPAPAAPAVSAAAAPAPAKAAKTETSKTKEEKPKEIPQPPAEKK